MNSSTGTMVARRTLAGVIAVGLLAPPAGFAQPAPTPGTPAPTTPTTPPKPAAGGPDDAPYANCGKVTGTVYHNFKQEIELKELITWVQGFACRNFILDPRIVSTGKKVTIIATNKLSPYEAYGLFLAAMSTMGLTVIPKGTTMRIVESTTAKTETVPIYRGGVPPNQDQVVRYILRPTHAPIETVRIALDAMKSPAGTVGVAGNLLLITDYASQVRDMMTVARAIDVPGNTDGIYTIPVQHSDATQLAAKLKEILGIGAAPAGQPPRAPVAPRPGTPAITPTPTAAGDEVSGALPTNILVDERTNTLIVVSSEAGYLRVKALVARLDISLEVDGGSSIHVYALANALAEELSTTLNSALGQAAPQRAPGGVPARPGQPPPPAGGAPPSSSNPFDGAALEGQVRIIGDKATNSLIVTSTGRDFIAIKRVIKDLDQARRQIYIEALILEVQLAKDLALGTSSHGGYPTARGDLLIGGVQTPNLKSLDLTSLVSANGLIGGLIGAPLANSQTFLGTSIPSYGLLFQALATQDNTNILSAPHVIAIDNEKAEFSVGNNIPYKAGISFGGFGLPGAGGAGGAAGSIGQNIQREKLNLTLNVTPHISSNDGVRLEIEQETKDIGGSDAELGPTWTERKLKTQVIVHDQQSVVIGGLIQERDIYSVAKVPLFGDIPILGYLFKYSKKTKKKTNLLILLTPYIIKDQLDLQSIRERKVREREEFVHSFSTLNEMKYTPKTDYRRKRGVVEEINRSIQSIEQDLEVLRGVGTRQMVIEGGIDYTPSGIESPDGPSTPGPAPAPAPTPASPPKKPK